jgi:hypothetical protein
MNGPLLISFLPAEQLGEAAKAPPDQVPYTDGMGTTGRSAGRFDIMRSIYGNAFFV